jgi:hypothetical protein
MLKAGAKAFLLAMALPLTGFSEEGDWGYAHNFYIKKSLTEKWSLLHRSQFALRDDMSDLFFGFADIGIGYRFHPSWRVDGVYRRAWFRPGDTWLIEDRPLINLTWFGKIKDARISNRHRVEFREYRWDKKDDLRYRNETRLELPQEILPFGIKPYFEEEFFYGKESGKFEMNWLTGGLYCKPNSFSKLKLGYRWIRIRAGDDWENRNQLVTALNLFF